VVGLASDLASGLNPNANVFSGLEGDEVDEENDCCYWYFEGVFIFEGMVRLVRDVFFVVRSSEVNGKSE